MRTYVRTAVSTLAIVMLLVSCQTGEVPTFDGIRGVVTDSTGSAVASARVVLTSQTASAQADSQSTVSTQTDSRGAFAFEHVGSGTYSITASTSDGLGSYKASVSFTGTGTLTIDLQVTPVGAISGTAVLEDRTEDSGGIDVYVPGTSFIAKTADDGAFTISGVPAGTYALHATYAGYLRSTVSGVTVASGKNTAIGSTIVLESQNPTDPDPPEPPEPPEPQFGRVSGTVTVVGSSGIPAASGGSGTSLIARTGPSLDQQAVGRVRDELPVDLATLDFVPGELIVGFKEVPGVSAASVVDGVRMLDAAGVQLARVQPMIAINAGLYRAPGLSQAETLELADALRARPDVAFVDPNYIYQPLAAPNDPFYSRQWHYDAIDMEGAWDVTTGSSDVVVAVLDTGILYSISDSSKRHPDFAGRVLPGYDFILEPQRAGDGDGRDADPYDPLPAGQFHGTHVAGTIGAASNNGVGVAGVDWNAKILPIRVLGADGGTLADIVAGLEWAVGSSVAGAPINPNPADVINLSLGGPGGCIETWQTALDFVSASAVVVVAAGNSNQNVSSFAPANCADVITVGATDRAGERSWFSNYGSRIDVMAPGGDLGEDLDSDGFPDGVLSLGYTSNFTYTFLQGTSMAAPHVTGVVALMKALDPTVDTARALEALRASATPLSNSACNGYGPGSGGSLISIDCGAGLIDAAKALSYLDEGEVPNPGGPTLEFSPSALEFGATTTRIDYTITNVSGSTLDWALNFYEEAGDNPGDMGPGAFTIPTGSPASGVLNAGATVATAIEIDRSELSSPGNYQIHLIFEVDGGTSEERLLMRFTKTQETAPPPHGPMTVIAYIEDEVGELVTSGSQSSSGIITDFDFEVMAGANVLAAWSDENGSGEVDAGDLFGYAAQSAFVMPGETVSGLDILVSPFVGSPGAGTSEYDGLIEALRLME